MVEPFTPTSYALDIYRIKKNTAGSEMIDKARKAAFYSLNFKAPYTYRLKGNETYPSIPASIITQAPSTLIDGIKKGELYSNHKEEFLIADFEIHDEYILILFNFTSDRYSDPAYYDKAKETRSTVQKSENEKMEFSCHVMIKRDIHNGAADMVVERVSGFSKMRLANLINTIFRKVKQASPDKFVHKHPDGSVDDKGNPRKCKFKIIVDVDGVPSDQMKNDIENGTISGLELVSHEKQKKWDDNGYFTEKKAVVKMNFSAPPGSRMDSLKSFLKKIKTSNPDIERAKLRFTPPGQTDGSESANFDLMEQDPTDCDHFNKTASLDYHADHTSYDGFVDEIVKSMKRHLRIQG